MSRTEAGLLIIQLQEEKTMSGPTVQLGVAVLQDSLNAMALSSHFSRCICQRHEEVLQKTLDKG